MTTMQKWYPLQVVSLVMVVSIKVSEEHGMQVMDNLERADTIINAYGLYLNTWLNDSPYAVPSPVTDEIFAIRIPHDLPEHLARLIGYGVAVYADKSVYLGPYVFVIMNKVNLLHPGRAKELARLYAGFFLAWHGPCYHTHKHICLNV